ncbi:hypothetical protein N183_31890 [Sinorhizobium sp. Sb3]|uniref:hypothetical protein n=1 Tax=Sinorhizobium sp. Sb3 TaxID=1358417 RepID=UPI00071C2401|nr:hypothetical protein [Sinorhizobium sp. Sb3]KSV67638.1 hypothetical protein N183_31890 [Sinorhizobium sp. Sb3]
MNVALVELGDCLHEIRFALDGVGDELGVSSAPWLRRSTRRVFARLGLPTLAVFDCGSGH